MSKSFLLPIRFGHLAAIFAVCLLFVGTTAPTAHAAVTPLYSYGMGDPVDSGWSCTHGVSYCGIVLPQFVSGNVETANVVRVRLSRTGVNANEPLTMQVYKTQNGSTSLNVLGLDPLPPYFGPLIAESEPVTNITEQEREVAFRFPTGLINDILYGPEQYLVFVIRSAGTITVWGRAVDPTIPLFAHTPVALKYYPDGHLIWDTWCNPPQGGDPCVPVGERAWLAPAIELAWQDTPSLEVGIDVKPGNTQNCFNNNGNGVLPVAILSSAVFDAATVNPYTILLDGMAVRVRGKGTLAHVEDVNGDSLPDLVVQIDDTDGVYSVGDTVATLTGVTYSGEQLRGYDSICIVPQ